MKTFSFFLACNVTTITRKESNKYMEKETIKATTLMEQNTHEPSAL